MASDDEDENIFMKGGLHNHVSMYSLASTNKNAMKQFDTDSDNDEPAQSLNEIALASRRRHKSSKHKRHRSKNEDEDNENELENENENGNDSDISPSTKKKQKEKENSVFNLHSNSDADDDDADDADVDDDDEVKFIPTATTTRKQRGRSAKALPRKLTKTQEQQRRKRLTQVKNVHLEQADGDAELRRILESTRNVNRETTEENIVEQATKEFETIQREKEENAKQQQKPDVQVVKNDDGGVPIVLKIRYKDKVKKMRIKTTTPLNRVTGPFCNSFGLDESKAVLEIDGDDVGENETPADYDLEDNNIVDLHIRL